MKIRLTAQIILSDTEAVVAYSIEDGTRGPSGETHFAVLLCTCDSGDTWTRVPLRRTLLNSIRYWGYPTWPPEAVMSLTSDQSGIRMIFRDEWVPFETGGESLWQAIQHRNGKWKTCRIRYMDYDGDDCPTRIPEIELSLPTCIKRPETSHLTELLKTHPPNSNRAAF
jgi:hypothetical protein